MAIKHWLDSWMSCGRKSFRRGRLPLAIEVLEQRVTPASAPLQPAADHLGFAAQPGPALVGQTLSPAVQVGVYDLCGGLLSDDSSDQVTISIASGPGNFTASSPTMVLVLTGTVYFNNLILTTPASTPFGRPAATSLRRSATVST
jgi:hypothetical protein